MGNITKKDDPTKFGKYNVVECLGEGSFGRAYKVFDRADSQRDTPYALKWLREGAEGGPLARFENEKWALQNIDHPAFPRFVDSGSERGRPYLVMSFANGRTIGSRIEANEKSQAFFSGLSVLLITEHLLDALAYLDSEKLQHRDIKDENVIVSSSGRDVTLIDLGFCKGLPLPFQNQTFWNAGAGRFAPPAKLENPSSSTISHDVFAVGVLCYRMLTNQYPWEVGQDGDAGDLKRLMLSKAPTPIQEINTAIDGRIAAIVMRMMDVRDSYRSPLQAILSDVKVLRNDLETAVYPKISKSPTLRLSRVIRDPVHGDVQMTDLEFAILNCHELQRLRRIRQLGTAHLVFPGAEHSRLAHAIGVTHISERIMRSIEMREGHIFSPEERWTARLYSLVHDVTHAPFGHTLEDELGFFERHDGNLQRLDRIFQRDDAQLPTALQASEIGRSVVDLLYGPIRSSPLNWVTSLLSASVGADVLDYIDRDSFFCGLDSRIDSAIYRRFTMDTMNQTRMRSKEILPRLYGNHGFRLDADYAVLSVLEMRYSLFLKVYSHPVKTAAGAMVGKALALSMRDYAHEFYESNIETMGDDELLHALQHSPSQKSVTVINRYLRRSLYRPAFLARIMQSVSPTRENYVARRESLSRHGLFDPVERLIIEQELAADHGLEEEDLILYASPKAPGAKTVSQRVEQSRGDVTHRDGLFGKHQEVFGQHLGLWNLFLFVSPSVPPDKRARLSIAMRNRFELQDEQSIDRKQLAFRL